MMFGVAEDHDSNPIKLGLGKLKARGAKFVSVNPVRTGYSAIADEWIGIRPGTDGLFVLALIHELLRTDRIDLDYLARYTNAPWLVVAIPAAPMTACSRATRTASRWSWDRARRTRSMPATVRRARPRSSATSRCPTAAGAVRCSSCSPSAISIRDYAPEAVAERCGIPADTIRRIAAELAARRVRQQIVARPSPWTDRAGRATTTSMIGRPVADACDARHLGALQRLPHLPRAAPAADAAGAVDTPGRLPLPAAVPEADPARPKPAGEPGQRKPDTPLRRPPLGFPHGPGGPAGRRRRQPRRIDQAFSWEAPLAAHGMLHTVIRNAHAGDPYPIDTLLMFMANMGWNSAMNTPRRSRMLTDKDADGEYRIPRIIYSDAYARRWSPMPTWCCRTRPTSSATTASRCSTGRSPKPTASGRCDPPAGGRRPTATCGPFQAVLLDLGARLGLAGMTTDRRRAALSRRLCRLHRPPSSARPASARSPAGAARTASSMATARRIPTSCSATSTTAASGSDDLPRACALLQACQPRLSRLGQAMGFVANAEPIVLAALCRDAAEIPPRRRRAMAPCSRPSASRARARPTSIRCRSGTSRSSSASPRRRASRSTPSPSGRCPCTTPGVRRTPGCGRSTLQPPLHHPATAERAGARRRRLGLGREPLAAACKAQFALMEGVQSATRSGPGTPSASARAPGRCRGRAGGDARLPAQPPDLRPAAGARDGFRLCQRRPGHRPGGVVRPARAHRARRGRARRDASRNFAARCHAAAPAEALCARVACATAPPARGRTTR